MTNQSTIDKLLEMRLTSMSDAYITQIGDPKMKDISFEDRFALLVDIEYNNRKSNGLKRLIRNAGFDQPEAYISDINYMSGRKLNRNLIERLATCEYITEYRNIFITGATGSGKTYMACAFGMEACKQRYKTKYVRLPDMLLELARYCSLGYNFMFNFLLSQYHLTIKILQQQVNVSDFEKISKTITLKTNCTSFIIYFSHSLLPVPLES